MITEEKIAELKEKHPELHLLEASGQQLVVRPPSRGEYRRFRHMATEPLKKADAAEHLLRGCVVYPEPQDVDRLLERKPALADVFAAKVLEIAGAVEEAQGKQL